VGGTGITPTGTVTLTSGSYSSGANALVGGVYSFTIPANSLAGGTDTITASYSGDANYASATGTNTVTVTESTFTLTAGTPSPATIAPGASSTVAVQVAAVAGYAGTVTLTCQQTSTTASGGDGATCSASGSGVTLSSGTTTGSVTLTVGTTAPVSAALVYPKVHKNDGWMGAGGGAVLAFLVFLGVPARRRSWRAMLGVLVLMGALGAMTACGSSTTGGGGGGGGGNSDPGTTAGTYTFSVVTATGNPSVTPAVTTTFTVTVN
jgi:hypothetical protein